MILKLNEIAESLRGDQSPDWFNDLRAKGLSRFSQIGIPTVKNEEWQYTNLRAMTKLTFEIAAENRFTERESLEHYRDDRETSVVLVNGLLSEELSDMNHVPKGISISTLREAVCGNAPQVRELLTKYDINGTAAFTALNQALGGPGIYIRVDGNISTENLIHIIHVTGSGRANNAFMPRTLVSVGKSSEVTVLESHVGFNDTITYFSNALTDIFLADNATLHYCKSQKESLRAYHVGHTRVWQERDSNFDGFSFMAGGTLTRNDLDVVFNGEGANARLNALYSVYEDQHVDNHTSVDHRVPNCSSYQLYKGILNNAARAVFNGKIIVRPVAQKTNSYQLNKNLLLGKDCRIDTKPQLEIFADDVKCTHGATIGQLDDDEMFYLRTRGIPKKAATEMLAHGFVNDLLSTVKNNDIREKLNRLMAPSFEALN